MWSQSFLSLSGNWSTGPWRNPTSQSLSWNSTWTGKWGRLAVAAPRWAPVGVLLAFQWTRGKKLFVKAVPNIVSDLLSLPAHLFSATVNVIYLVLSIISHLNAGTNTTTHAVCTSVRWSHSPRDLDHNQMCCTYLKVVNLILCPWSFIIWNLNLLNVKCCVNSNNSIDVVSAISWGSWIWSWALKVWHAQCCTSTALVAVISLYMWLALCQQNLIRAVSLQLVCWGDNTDQCCRDWKYWFLDCDWVSSSDIF